MTHVQITAADNKKPSIQIDGVEIVDHVLVDGFAIKAIEGDGYPRWEVVMKIAADTLDVDLPEALAKAVSA